jgi:hypothetical protein
LNKIKMKGLVEPRICKCKLLVCNCRQLTDAIHGVGGVWSHPPKTNVSGAAGSGAAGSGAEQPHPQPIRSRNPSEDDEDAIHVVLHKQYSAEGEDFNENDTNRRQILVPANDDVNNQGTGFRRFLQWIRGAGNQQEKDFDPEAALNNLTVKEYLNRSKLRFSDVAARSLGEVESEGNEDKVSTCCLFENKCCF